MERTTMPIDEEKQTGQDVAGEIRCAVGGRPACGGGSLEQGEREGHVEEIAKPEDGGQARQQRLRFKGPGEAPVTEISDAGGTPEKEVGRAEEQCSETVEHRRYGSPCRRVEKIAFGH